MKQSYNDLNHNIVPSGNYLLSASVDDIKEHKIAATTTNVEMLKLGFIFQSRKSGQYIQYHTCKFIPVTKEKNKLITL